MPHQVTAPNPGELDGISAKTNDIHHGKLYTAYVNKRNEIEEAQRNTDLTTANQIFSSWRGLKEGETFAANGMILHECYFSILGGDGNPEGTTIKSDIEMQWGSWDRFIEEFTATGLGARGWAILAYDSSDSKLHIYAADSQNHGGVWGTIPLVPCDVYEHAYFIDFGADRKAYIGAFFKNLDWKRVEERYLKINK
jgi:Fe-Mn family superoxide dismutase